MAAGAPPSLDCLPDQLLGHIFALAGQEEGRSLTLVSTRWRDLFYAQPEVWHTFVVRLPRIEQRPQEEWQRCVDARLALLRRMAPHVAAFSWQGGNDEEHNWRSSEAEEEEEEDYGWQGSSEDEEEAGYAAMPAFYTRLSAFLAALRPEQLVDLQLLNMSGLSESYLIQAALGRLTGVTRLTLSGIEPYPLLPALRSLGSRPHSLCVEVYSDSERLMPAILLRSELTELQLCLPDDAGQLQLPQLTRLTRLRSLTVERSQAAEACRAVRYRYHAPAGGGAQPAPPPAVPLPTQFPAGLESFTFALNRMQVAGVELQLCSLQRQPAPRWAPDSSRPTLRTLTLGHAQQLPPLQQFLGQLLHSSAALECLVLRDSGLSVPALFGCTRLSQLSEMALLDSRVPPDVLLEDAAGVPLEDALAPLLQQASSLSGLTLCNEGLESPGARLLAVPPCITIYGGLTYLALFRQGLTDLPNGAYLPSLRCLDLQHNDLRELPAALAACTALSCLSLDYNWRMLLRHSYLDTLRTLRMLRRFDAEYVQDEEPGFCHGLHALLPALRIKFRASNLVTPSWGL